MLIEERIYVGASNIISLVLRQDMTQLTHTNAITPDSEIDSHGHPAINRCILQVLPIIDDPTDAVLKLDSNTPAHAGFFDFIADPLVLQLKLSNAGIKTGRHRVDVVIFEAGGPANGVAWGCFMLDLVDNQWAA